MIDATNRQIDWPAYELYGLTEDEVEIGERMVSGVDTWAPAYASAPPGLSFTR